jgi:hypothetical protein
VWKNHKLWKHGKVSMIYILIALYVNVSVVCENFYDATKDNGGRTAENTSVCGDRFFEKKKTNVRRVRQKSVA